MLYRFECEQWIPVATEEVFRFFANPENLPRIMPRSSGTKLLKLNIVAPASAPAGIALIAGAGSEIITSFRVIPYLPFRRKWVARIVEFEWGHYFADVQQKGPFRSFLHRHELRAETRGEKPGTVIRDAIEYEIGFGALDAIANLFVARQLRSTFQERQRMLERILAS